MIGADTKYTSDSMTIVCGLKANTQYSYEVRSIVGSKRSHFVSSDFTTFSYGMYVSNLTHTCMYVD